MAVYKFPSRFRFQLRFFRRLAGEAFERSIVWMHPVAVLAAFITDFINPVIEHCTIWFLALVAIAITIVCVLFRFRKLESELAQARGAAALAFLGIAAVSSVAIICMQQFSDNPKEGVLALVVPALTRLQTSLDFLEPKIDRLEIKLDKVEVELLRIEAAISSKGADAMWQAPWPQPCSGKRLCILVAGLDHDSSGTQTTYVEESLRDSLHIEADDAPVQVIFVPRQLREPIGGDLKLNALAVRALGERWLEKMKGDVLIYGSVIAQDHVMRLRFLSKEGGKGDRYSLDATASLPLNFNSDMGSVLAARAIAAVAPAREEGQFITLLLEKITTRLRALIGNRPSGMTDGDYYSVVLAYADSSRMIGQQSSDEAYLHEAIKYYLEYQSRYTRDIDPTKWADAQVSLGNVFAAIGERKGNWEDLDRAATIFRDAATVLTRERYPAEWAMVQNNLALALIEIGQRENASDHLQQAITALHGTLEEYTRSNAPILWAMAKNTLGIALAIVGEREDASITLIRPFLPLTTL